MEILTKLTKEVFEKYVPAAKMPERNDSVYNRLKEQFQQSYNNLVRQYIGVAFVTDFEAMVGAEGLVLHAVSVDAFIRQARSLDLVLTATGFGIVSTESTAPASQQRVDSLLAQLRLELLHVLADIVRMLLLVEGWPDSGCAWLRVNTLLWDPDNVWPYVTMEPSAENWVLLQGRIREAENIIRCRAAGDDYMDYLLNALRHGSFTPADRVVRDYAVNFILNFVNTYDPNEAFHPGKKYLLDDVIRTLEAHPEEYPAYMDSSIYKARHMERYENKRKDPSFFFTT